ncbi:MAG TPA: ABC transporter permease [Burkholderiales bacterium]
MILNIAWRELRSLFLSPLAWAVLAVLQGVLGYLFLARVGELQLYRAQLLAMESAPGTTELVVPALFGSAAIILLLVVPLITMRLIAEERRNRTLPLLFSAPVSMTEIVLGKYLGVLLFLLLVVALIALMPLALLAGGTLDFGLLGSALLGLTLALASFAAIGTFMSTMTQHPTVAAIGGFGVLVLFWIIDPGQGSTRESVVAYLSMFNHYQPFLSGVFDTGDAIYHLLVVVTFLALSIRRLDADRLGG